MDLNLQNLKATAAPVSIEQNTEFIDISQTIPKIEFDKLDELHSMAEANVRETRLGEFSSKPQWPFEKQIGSDFKVLYGELSPFFVAADKERLFVRTEAIKLRIFTGALFIIYLAALYVFLQKFSSAFQNGSFSSGKLLEPGALLPFIFIVACWLGTKAVRSTTLNHLENRASRFGSSFNSNLQQLWNKADICLRNVEQHGSRQEGCGERAEKWTHVALWLFNMRGIYDRYVTTASWRAQFSLRAITVVSKVLKWGLAIIFLSYLVFMTTWFTANLIVLMAGLFFLFITPFSWDLLSKSGASNNIWAENFVKAVSGRTGEEIISNHMITKVSKLMGAIREEQFQSANT